MTNLQELKSRSVYRLLKTMLVVLDFACTENYIPCDFETAVCSSLLLTCSNTLTFAWANDAFPFFILAITQFHSFQFHLPEIFKSLAGEISEITWIFSRYCLSFHIFSSECDIIAEVYNCSSEKLYYFFQARCYRKSWEKWIVSERVPFFNHVVC